MKVLTVTLNPSVDVRLEVDALKIGEKNQGTSQRIYGGKGINVSKILRDLGMKTTATGFIGEYNYKGFSAYFKENGIEDEFIRVEGTTRINTKIEINRPRSTTMIYDPGFLVSPQNVKDILKKVSKLAKDHDMVVLSGSIPSNVSDIIYADLIDIIRERRRIVMLDTGGTPLRLGIRSRPHIVKPNLEELSFISDKSDRNLTIAEALKVCKDYVKDGIGTMVVSMGGKGALWIDSDRQIEAIPPSVPINSTTGAGDAMVAGISYGVLKGWKAEKVMGFATALAAYTVSRAKIGFEDIRKIEDLEAVTQVKAAKL